MTLRFINPTMHGVADYSAGLVLIVAPFLLGLGKIDPESLTISVGTGVAVLIASLLTDYKLGLFRRIPFQGHLAIDLVVATSFVAIPLLLGFVGIEFYYYLINATVVFLVVALSSSK